jgi:hypothetical protein
MRIVTLQCRRTVSRAFRTTLFRGHYFYVCIGICISFLVVARGIHGYVEPCIGFEFLTVMIMKSSVFWVGRWSEPTNQRNISPPSSELKSKPIRKQRGARIKLCVRYVSPKRQLTFTTLCGVISQKMELFVLIPVQFAYVSVKQFLVLSSRRPVECHHRRLFSLELWLAMGPLQIVKWCNPGTGPSGVTLTFEQCG